MGRRLINFDYSRPYFYMVTLKCCKQINALSEIVAPGRCKMNAITKAFVSCIRNFHNNCKVIAPIQCFSIMPDHIHLLIRIINDPKCVTLKEGEVFIPLRLEAIIGMLMQTLEGCYHEIVGKRDQVFEASWHDWIVARDGQLTAFTRYIRDNPERSWQRQLHREFFQRVNEINFLDHKWYGYGNAALLQLPVLEPVRYSRSLLDGSEDWKQAIARAERIGPGGTGVGTFMSPCEKACGHALGLAGGQWVVLSPEGFSEHWHPGRQYERFCAEGRMLFISLWPAMARQPTNAELYTRCHLMGDIIMNGLSTNK